MKFGKKITALGLVFSLLMSGCGNGSGEDGKEVSLGELDGNSAVISAGTGGSGASGDDGKAMGRFLENDIRPEGMENVYDIRETSDGKLLLLGMEGDCLTRLSSLDCGQTWETEREELMKVSLNQENIYSAALTPDGGAFVAVMNYAEYLTGSEESEPEEPNQKSGYYYYLISENGEKQELELSESISSGMGSHFVFADDGSFYVENFPTMYCLDPESGAILKSFEVGAEYVSDFGVLGDTLYIYGESLELYDRESAELLEVPSVLNEQLTALGSTPVFTASGDQELYFANRAGIYRYVRGGSVVEQVVNSSLNTLSSPDFYIGLVRVLSDGSLLVSGYDSTEGYCLFRYVYDADTPTLPETELKVYSLEESSTLRQAINMYQKSHPDVYVTLEIGLSGSDGVTASDALRTLNTNLMSGNGPDVLILDGMNWKKYQEKGILTDVSALVDEVNSSEGLFDNIVAAYRIENGIYALPTHFTLPAILGEESQISSAVSLNGLMEQALALADGEHSFLGRGSVTELAEVLAASCQNAWRQENGSLNENAMKEFLQAVQTLYDIDRSENNVGGNSTMQNSSVSVADLSMLAMEYVGGKQMMHLGQIQSAEDFGSLVSTADAVAGSSYALFEGQDGPAFVPKMIAGISSQSKEMEAAADFFQYLLSEECQSIRSQGFPLNRKAYESSQINENEEELFSMIGVNDEEGNEITLGIRRPTKEEFAWLDAQVEKVSVPADDDQVVFEAMLKACESLESVSVEEALAQVMQTLQIYLSE